MIMIIFSSCLLSKTPFLWERAPRCLCNRQAHTTLSWHTARPGNCILLTKNSPEFSLEKVSLISCSKPAVPCGAGLQLSCCCPEVAGIQHGLEQGLDISVAKASEKTSGVSRHFVFLFFFKASILIRNALIWRWGGRELNAAFFLHVF